jgi:hypothetical protein
LLLNAINDLCAAPAPAREWSKSLTIVRARPSLATKGKRSSLGDDVMR